MKKKIIWIALIIILACIFIYKIKAGGQAVTVEMSKVTKGDITEYVEEAGNLMLEEETIIYSTAAGKVARESKKAGETVKAGEVLLEIDNDLNLQIKALEAQKQSVSAQYAEKKEASDDNEIKKLEAEVRAKEASYDEAKSAADNNKVLYQAGAVSQDTLKSSITKLAAAEASLEAARGNLTAAKKGASVNVRKQYEAQLSEIQAKIDQLKKKSEDMVIKSPFDGLITSSEVKAGNVVQVGSKLFEIGGSKGYYIETDILIEDISGVKLSSPVIIENEDLGIKELKGTVRKIYPKAFNKISDLGIEQKRVKVEIEITDIPENLRPGYDMTVKIITRTDKDVLLIDEKALFQYQGKDHVFVNENGTAVLRPVEKGLESDERVEIVKGLKAGEEVVLSPDETLKEGIKIKK